MAKKKKDLRVEIIKSLEGIKKFNIAWTDEINKSLTIEAKDAEEARKLFYEGDLDFDSADQGDINYVEGSLDIEEIEND
jgi:hypothetical protein